MVTQQQIDEVRDLASLTIDPDRAAALWSQAYDLMEQMARERSESKSDKA